MAPRGKDPVRYTCVGCGHEHLRRPEDNKCEKCGQPRVIDLHTPGYVDIKAVAHALEEGSPRHTIRNLASIVGAILVFCIGLWLGFGLVGDESETGECLCRAELSASDEIKATGRAPEVLATYASALRPGLDRCLTLDPSSPADFRLAWWTTAAGTEITTNVGDSPRLRGCIVGAVKKLAPALPAGGGVEGMLWANLCLDDPPRLSIKHRMRRQPRFLTKCMAA